MPGCHTPSDGDDARSQARLSPLGAAARSAWFRGQQDGASTTQMPRRRRPVAINDCCEPGDGDRPVRPCHGRCRDCFRSRLLGLKRTRRRPTRRERTVPCGANTRAHAATRGTSGAAALLRQSSRCRRHGTTLLVFERRLFLCVLMACCQTKGYSI